MSTKRELYSFLSLKGEWTRIIVSALISIGFCFYGFVSGVEHEREKWSKAIGSCSLPATKLDALLIMRSDSGALYCQPRMR